MLGDVDVITERAVGLASRAVVVSHLGEELTISPQSLCLHGDNAAEVATARSIAAALQRHPIALHSFI